MKWILCSLLLFPLALPSATPFANNLYGLKCLALEINGDQQAAKKAGYPFEAIRKDIKAAMEKAGLKVVKGQNDVPEGKKAFPAELMLGMVNKKDLYSYAVTLQAYEPMQINGGVHLYVAWSSLLYGFGTQSTVKEQLREQVKILTKAFVDDLKAAKKR